MNKWLNSPAGRSVRIQFFLSGQSAESNAPSTTSERTFSNPSTSTAGKNSRTKTSWIEPLMIAPPVIDCLVLIVRRLPRPVFHRTSF